jgi:hypothetical protein
MNSPSLGCLVKLKLININNLSSGNFGQNYAQVGKVAESDIYGDE